MPILSIEKPLREKLGEEAVDALVRLINSAQEGQKKDILVFVEEKFERRLAEEILKLEVMLTQQISETKADMIKWMFIFWIGQVAVTMGMVFVFLNK